jgi:lysophospholipase L1-like esterase
MVIAAVGAVSVLALLPVTSAHGTARSPWATPRPDVTYSLSRHFPAQAQQAHQAQQPGASLAACENEMDHAQRGDSRPAPRLAVVGASFTAGVGSGNPDRSWAVLLARLLHWDAVVYGDPGTGYVRAGVGRQGPVADEIARVDLRALAPALVIVQAGHDDIGVPPGLERQKVGQVVALIRAEAPRARIALLTVFTGPSRSPAAYRTDHAIVTAASAADRNVIIMDPLAGGWTFQHAPDGLHPTAAGSAWIARTVAEILRGHGVLPAPARAKGAPARAKGAPARTQGTTICDSGLPASAPRGHRADTARGPSRV